MSRRKWSLASSGKRDARRGARGVGAPERDRYTAAKPEMTLHILSGINRMPRKIRLLLVYEFRIFSLPCQPLLSSPPLQQLPKSRRSGSLHYSATLRTLIQSKILPIKVQPGRIFSCDPVKVSSHLWTLIGC